MDKKAKTIKSSLADQMPKWFQFSEAHVDKIVEKTPMLAGMRISGVWLRMTKGEQRTEGGSRAHRTEQVCVANGRGNMGTRMHASRESMWPSTRCDVFEAGSFFGKISQPVMRRLRWYTHFPPFHSHHIPLKPVQKKRGE